jgi:hypothetical protein
MRNLYFSFNHSLLAQYQRAGPVARRDDITANLAIHPQASTKKDASFDTRANPDE